MKDDWSPEYSVELDRGVGQKVVSAADRMLGCAAGLGCWAGLDGEEGMGVSSVSRNRLGLGVERESSFSEAGIASFELEADQEAVLES